jgi:hypothetical protein
LLLCRRAAQARPPLELRWAGRGGAEEPPALGQGRGWARGAKDLGHLSSMGNLTGERCRDGERGGLGENGVGGAVTPVVSGPDAGRGGQFFVPSRPSSL